MKLTQERLKELLDYNPETGIFIWKVYRAGLAKLGYIAGHLTVTGYWKICIDKKIYRSHRLAFLYMEGYMPENGVDHIDRDRANNKWANLREVSQSCNLRNRGVLKGSVSKVSGVSWDKCRHKWQAQVKTHKKICLGRFDNLTDAVKARWEAEVKYGYPNCNTTSSSYAYLIDKGEI